MLRKYGARDVTVFDDNFSACSKIAMGVCDELRLRNFDATWSVEARVDTVSREILKTLKGAGCTLIAYGIESGSQRVLDHVNKRINKDQIRMAVRMAKEEGMAVRGYFMLGFPTETAEEMGETIRFALELDVDIASFALLIPFPGTVEYARACKTGIFPDPEYHHNRLIPEFNFLDAPLYIPEGMAAAELLAIHRSAYCRYYFRPKTVVGRVLSARSIVELVSIAKGGVTLVADTLKRK